MSRVRMLAFFSMAALALVGCDDDGSSGGDATMTADATSTAGDTSTSTGADTSTSTGADTSTTTEADTSTTEADTSTTTSDDMATSTDPDTTMTTAVDMADMADTAMGSPCADFSECAVGEFCGNFDMTTMMGTCEPSQCDGVFSPDRCAMGEKCVPAGVGAYVCVPEGAGAIGTACMEDTECAGNALCLDGNLCTAPPCSVGSNEATCATGMCEAFGVEGVDFDFGFCVDRCDPFGANTCATGWCIPDTRDPGTGTIGGVCVDSSGGMGAAGDACDGMTPCGDDLLCIGDTCRSLCDPDAMAGAAGSCATAGDFCGGLQNADGDPLDWGACFPGCTPYTVPSQCAAGQWCVPTQTDITRGQCVAHETGAEGELCGEMGLPGCGADLICLGFSATEARCVRTCDPAAMSADPGGCGMNFDCAGLQSGMTPLAFGFCQETCSYVHGGAAADCTAFGSCVLGELLGQPDGACSTGVPVPELNELDDCTAAGLAEGELCSANGVCLVIGAIAGPDVLCYETCATSEGAFNTTNHPDCSRATAVCSQLFMSTEFGVCGLDG